MPRVNRYFSDLSREVFVLGTASAISVLLIATTYSYYDQSHRARRDAEDRLDDAVIKYNVAKDRNQLLNKYTDEYRALVKQGIAGSEHRLNWIEIIRKYKLDNNIPALAFNIYEQKKQKYKNLNTDFPRVNVYISRMKMDLSLAHEVDLIRLFKELNENAEGLFIVNHCDISLSAPGSEIILDNPSIGNLNGYCELDWFTVRPEETSST